MQIKRLQTRFVLAGMVLVISTVASSFWSIWTFARLSTVAGDTLRDSQTTIDMAALLASALEREDDALLLALSGNAETSKINLDSERQQAEQHYRRLVSVIKDDETEERELLRRLRGQMDSYRKASTDLIAVAGPDGLKRYHQEVNPLLRDAVATCAKLREANFKQMQQAGVSARDNARQATLVVVAVSIAGLTLTIVVALWLARSILLPVRELTVSVDALRKGEFDRRVQSRSSDELGELADGFNRMAESLSEYRRSSLGELLATKITLESTLNALPDAVFVIAPDGDFVAVNPPGKAVLDGMTVSKSTNIKELPLLPKHTEAVNSALAGQRRIFNRMDFQHTLSVKLAGKVNKFSLAAAPIPQFQAQHAGAIVVLDNVTEFARLDELRSELIGVASHELKTPLTTLRMNLLLLRENTGNLTPRQQEFLSTAVSGCEELSSTIDELLDVTRIEAGQLRLNLAPVDVYPILEKSVRGLRPRFDDGRIIVKIESTQTAGIVRGDAARLSLVFSNLLSNALKYAPPDSAVTVSVASMQNAVSNAGATLQIAVTDCGPGIPAQFRERVFEKFFRVEHEHEQEPQRVRGTGIGLYLCREIVKAHGGTIVCESGDRGIGARIVLSLPVDKC